MKTTAAPNSGARKIILVVAVVVTVCLLSLIVAGFTSLVSLAERIHPIAGVYAWLPAFLRSIALLHTQSFLLRSFRRKKIQVRSTTRIYRLSVPDSQQIRGREESRSPQSRR